MTKTKVVISLAALLMLSGCNFDFFGPKKPTGKRGGSYPASGCSQPMIGNPADKIVVDKSDRKMYLYRNGKTVASFKVSLGANDHKGYKVRKGDKRTPIGMYSIVNKRCHTVKYMAMTISYPNATDRAKAAKLGVNPGNLITIHGQPHWNRDGHGDSYTLSKDWTDGCIALTNSGMRKLWSMVKPGTSITLKQ